LKHRTFKQIVIATIFFGFWSSLGALIFWLNYEPAPDGPGSGKEAQPLEVVDAKIIATSQGKADILGVIRNPNADAGASDVKFQLIVSNGGQVLQTIPGSTFILPNDEKYVMALNRDVPAGSSVKLELKNPKWAFVDSTFRPPTLVVVNKPTRIIPGAVMDTFELKGLLANQSNVDYQKVQVGVVGLDAEGNVVGTGETFMGSLKSLERREFTVQWPLQKGKQVVTLKIHPEVNVFLSDAIQVREGLGQNPIDIPVIRASANPSKK